MKHTLIWMPPLLLPLLFWGKTLIAETNNNPTLAGRFDVQLTVEQPADCDNNIVYFDIGIRASNAGNSFHISEQNYHFTYNNSVLANPVIEQELTLSGSVTGSGGVSFYTGHTLIGSTGNTISYNIELSNGPGYLIGTDWVFVGRLAFDIINPSGCFDLSWNDSNDSPSTFISEKINNQSFEVASGIYFADEICATDVCACPPAGTPCDDNDSMTENDVEDGFCICRGTPISGNGQFDVRFISPFGIDCEDGIVHFDIEVKASNTNSTFRIADQNYRFTFDDTQLINPRIETALEISGQVSDDGGISTYDTHTLSGSSDLVFSYTITLDSGPGYLIGTDWVSVGRLAFDIIGSETCFNLDWYDSGALSPTFISEKISNGQVVAVPEGTYTEIEECLGLSVELSVFLEGAMSTDIEGQYTDTMRSDLYQRGLLPGQTPVDLSPVVTPPGQPYNAAPWNYTGTEGANWTDAEYNAIANANGQGIVDWVLVSFRTTLDADSEVTKTAALLLGDGKIVFVKDCYLSTAATALYVMVEHRNHMGSISATPIPIEEGLLSFAFTRSAVFTGADPNNPVGAGQQEVAEGTYALYAGDGEQVEDAAVPLNPSYNITGSDKIVWTIENGAFSTYSSADYSMNGDTNGFDNILLIFNLGTFSVAPR